MGNTEKASWTRSLPVRIALFAFGPALSIIVPLLTLPSISANFGAPGWASIAVGQSLGVAASIVIELGWTVAGPIQVARGDVGGQATVFRRSLVERGCVALVALPVLWVLIYLVQPAFAVEAFFTSVAMALGGMSAAWFYVGTGASLRMLFLDSVPRVASSIAGAALLMGGAPLISLPIAQLGASLALPFLPLAWLPKSSGNRVGGLRSQLAFTWQSQGAAFVTRVASSAYVALPTALMATVAPVLQVATFAAIDRVGRTALAALAPFNLALQGWIPSVEGDERLRRMKAALCLSSILAVGSFFGFWLFAPWVIDLLFVGEVVMENSAVLAFSIVVACVVLSRCTGIQCLAVLGKTWTTAASTIVGFVVSVPLVLVLGTTHGAVGVAWGIAVTEITVLSVQVFALVGTVRSVALDKRDL